MPNQTTVNYHKMNTMNETADKSYQPVPDGRFYTKANFFTLADRNNAELNQSRETDGGNQALYNTRPSHLTDGMAIPENGAVPFP